MADLTQIFGDKGLVIDPNFVFANRGKSEGDLLTHMREQGLEVDYLDTSGELVRTRVSAVGGVRPDKNNEQSGWYVFNALSYGFVCLYGNWRLGTEHKFSSFDAQSLSTSQQRDLKSQLDEAKKRRKEAQHIQYKQVSEYAQTKFQQAKEVKEHKYLQDKNIQSYGLKITTTNALMIPVKSIIKDSDNGLFTEEIMSLQYIYPNGDKKFASGGQVKGNYFLINCDVNELKNIEKLYVVEGYATGCSIAKLGLPVVVVFSANFCLTTLTTMRSMGIKSKFVLCLDNDENGVGQSKAKEVKSVIPNCVIKLPSIKGDFNDLENLQGSDAVKSELLDQTFGIKNYSIRHLTGEAPQVEWLVDKFIPLRPGLIASPGGVGKSMVLIDLALKIAIGGSWLGKNVLQSGNSVIFCAEDDKMEVHRRINALDPYGARHQSPYDVFIVTIPDTGKPLILLREDGITDEAEELIEELKLIPDLKMVGFDPIQAFSLAPISQSNEAGQLWASYCAGVSANLNCSCISIHHLNKSALTNDSDDPLSHRQEIRGATSLVDGMRWAIAMWLADSSTAEQVCMEHGVDTDRLRVVRAGIVKSNSGLVDTKVKTLFRKNAVLEILENKKSFEWD